jgi:MoaA/NifB/PqqE/SkfB family radical SAM enzyme
MHEGLSAVVTGKPKSIMIELTNHCQLECITCPRDKEDAHDYDFGVMPLENFKHIFGQFKSEVDTLDLTGLGESLMHPEIFEIIRWVRSQREVHIYLTTNTILLTKKTVEKFRRDPVDTLCISIDGTTQRQFASIRGNLSFNLLKERVSYTVEQLNDRMHFIMCVVLVKENLDDMPAFVELAADLGIRQLSLKPINLVANSTPSGYYSIFRGDKFRALAEESRELGERRGIQVDVFEIGNYSCTFPWDPLYVTWDGYLVPCCAKPFPKRKNFGNLLEKGFDELKNLPSFVGFRHLVMHNEDSPAFCNKCHIMEKTLFRE